MNVFILTDLEGIAGVDSIDFMDRQGVLYQKARNLLTEELIFAGEVCREMGADNIYFLDGHGGGGNIHPELIPGWLRQCSLGTWQQLLRDGAIDCQIELGTHARAGTTGGFLDHTLSSKTVYSHKINGIEYGELGLHALLCGNYGVPIVFCSGDEVACHQAKEYIPGIFTTPVKHAKVRNTAATYPDARQRLRSGITAALAHYQEIPPCRPQLPAQVTVTYYRTDMCEEVFARHHREAVRQDARTLTKSVEKITSYYDLRF